MTEEAVLIDGKGDLFEDMVFEMKGAIRACVSCEIKGRRAFANRTSHACRPF